MTDYEGHRFCQQEDTSANRGGLCKWDMTPPVIGWYCHVNDNELGNLSRAGVLRAIQEACSRWEKVCGIRFYKADSPQNAHFVVGAGIQGAGPGGTLAWSELPCGQDRQLHQQYDRRERWVIADNPGGDVIDLTRVMCHEIGHVIGISHIGSGNLMAPTYSRNISHPQAGDIVEGVARYPKLPEQPSQPENPQPGSQYKIVLEVGADGKINSASLLPG